MAPEKAKPSLSTVLTELRGKRGLHIGSLLDFDMSVKSVSTGNIAIDSITGVGGLPRGRIIELFGPPSSGKTTTALQTAVQVQQAGGRVHFQDFEKSLDPHYCQALGLDVANEDTFLYMQPSSFEEGGNTFRRLMETGELDMFIVDSVAMMVAESELNAETGKPTMADRAKLMAQFMRQIVDPVARHQIVVVFLNHVNEVIDVSPMGQQLKARGVVRKNTPGGQSLKFNSSLRMEYKQVGNLRNEVFDPLSNDKVAEVRQTKVQVTVVKNKVAEPFKTTEVRVRYGKGFSQAYSVLDILTRHKIIKKSGGGIYSIPLELAPDGVSEAPKIKGEENLVSLIESHPIWQEKLRMGAQALLDKWGADKVSDDEIAQLDDNGEPKESVDEDTGEIIV